MFTTLEVDNPLQQKITKLLEMTSFMRDITDKDIQAINSDYYSYWQNVVYDNYNETPPTYPFDHETFEKKYGYMQGTCCTGTAIVLTGTEQEACRICFLLCLLQEISNPDPANFKFSNPRFFFMSEVIEKLNPSDVASLLE